EVDLLALEIEALRRLDQVGALTAEQASVTRSDRFIRVQMIVDDRTRKKAVLDALAGLPTRVRVEVVTLDEAARRHSMGTHGGFFQTADLSRDRLPLDAEIRAYLEAHPPTAAPLVGVALDDAVRRFASEILTHSLEARLHARTVLSLAERVPSTTLGVLSSTT